MHIKTCLSSSLPQEHENEAASFAGNVEDRAGEDFNPDLPGQSDEFQSALTVEEKLQEEAVGFLVTLKEQYHSTQTVIDAVIPGVNRINQKFLEVLEWKFKDMAGASGLISLEVLELTNDLKQLSLFEGVDSKDEIIKYLVENAGLVLPERVVFRSEQQIVNGELKDVDIDFAYQIPFLKQVERFLNCKGVLHCVDNSRKSEEDFLETLLDGYLCRNHPVFLKYPNALVFILYHDGVEVTDMGSSRQGEYNITNFYWVLANIDPELRSSDRVINLLAIVKTSDLKVYKYEKILSDFIDGMNKLSSDEGVTMIIHGEARIFHGFFLGVVGDYPAQGAIGGFKEGVSAEKPCRNCMASQEQNYLTISDISRFAPRCKEIHEQHVREVEDYEKLSSRDKELYGPNPSVSYGVNGRSELSKIKHVDVTKMMPQDLMHAGNEGILEYCNRVLLCHVIKTKKKFTLDDVNKLVVEYSKYLSVDKPSIILPEHLNYKLRQSAAQMYSLAIILPFVLQEQTVDGSYIFAGDAEFLECFVSFMKIMNLASAYKFKPSDAQKLRVMTQNFHEKLLKIDPECNMAKLHFIHHLAELIELYGSIRQLACFRFEAHHALFKRLVKITRNFINLLHLLATRHQTKQVNQMQTETFLYSGHEYTVKEEVHGRDDTYTKLVKRLFPNCVTLAEISRLKMHGTLYKKDKVILLSDSEDCPEFSVIQKTYLIDVKHFASVCLKLKTVELNEQVHAFEVSPTSSRVVVDALKLVFPHDIITIKSEGRWFALPLGHRDILT